MLDDTINEIHKVGHRKFIGGDGAYWDTIGDLQFAFLKNAGLASDKTFVDVACGSLRLGSRLIPYLEPRKYFGIDKYIELVIYGVSKELGLNIYNEKQPRFLINDRFDFSEIDDASFDFGIAQSLFTHLTSGDISLCLERLRAKMTRGGVFFATFFEAAAPVANPERSHSHDAFLYTKEQLAILGAETGWNVDYIGEWGHPRRQKMMRFTAG